MYDTNDVAVGGMADGGYWGFRNFLTIIFF